METEHRNLQELADRVGLSLFHFHRVFKNVTGVTPKQYAVAQRADRVKRELGKAASVTEAIYAAGFNSSGRFYADTKLGMTPSNYRKGGAGTTIRFAVGACSLGPVLVAQSARGVCAILLGEGAREELRKRFPRATLIEDDNRAVAAAVAMVDRGARFDLPLDIQGTAFQQRVWTALQAIPVGTTASYAEIAEKIGAPKSVRAVAGACAANALAVAIPCHRVVRSDGELSGYRWGVERKKALLERESRG